MIYHIVLEKDVQKSLKKIDKKFQGKIFAAIAGLSMNPYLGKKLHGKYADFWSYRVWPYRIIYGIRSREVTVIIVKIGHRQGVY